jgi:UDP-N-acetylmuramate--alanine ligase
VAEEKKHIREGLSPSDNIYFLGIGGIGMSALARYFLANGHKVSGYDKTPTPLTKELEASGMQIHYVDDVQWIDKEAAIVVYTPAIPAEHSELNFYRNNHYQVVKRSDVLQMITNSSFNICVAGTHGKTTMSTMIGHLLRHSGFGCNAFLGGISSNYETNFWSSENNCCVVEADEYDRSFLKLNPDVAIISAMDADHLDIYGTAEEMENAFVQFTKRIKPGGLLISKYGLKRMNDLQATNHWTYHLNNEQADVHAVNVKMNEGSYAFDVQGKGWKLDNVVLNMGGMHNVENAVAAIAVAMHLNIDAEKIKAAVADFKGVKRRFAYLIKNEKQVMIDDYAHHPAELKALIESAKALFPNKKSTILFQPHLFSRTRDFADDFAAVLDLADQIVLLPIYPARELPMAGVTSEMLLNKMKNKNSRVLDKQEALHWLQENETPLLITAGAGDIDAMLNDIKNLKEK